MSIHVATLGRTRNHAHADSTSIAADARLVDDMESSHSQAAGSRDHVVPTFVPHLNTEGHKKICEILLPLLWKVMGDAQWCAQPPRVQVKEACDRYLVAVV